MFLNLILPFVPSIKNNPGQLMKRYGYKATLEEMIPRGETGGFYSVTYSYPMMASELHLWAGRSS